jgi:DNA-binding response OmpR family regulator
MLGVRWSSPTRPRELAAALDTLVASPPFARWRQGTTLEIGARLTHAHGWPPGIVVGVAHLDEPRPATKAAPESSIPATATRPLIWIVDDSPTQADHSRATLCDEGEIVVFGGGAAALERFGTDRRPDLVLLDWNMPDISGLDVCRFIRTVANAAEIPILVVTATGDIESLYEAFDAGVNDFVRKPFPATELKVRARALVRAKQDHDRLAEVERRLRIEAEYREKFIGMLAHDLRQPVSTFTLTNHIVEQIAKAHGGAVHVLSEAGETKFGVTLPHS